ncbi:MAG TPA: hypothetical protein VJO12_00845 [Stellaceae bacterium]|nr:hypothetical protein [Stellaceae bacterium]
MLIDLVTNAALALLEAEVNLMSRLAASRKRCEGWLQVELYKRLLTECEVELERPYLDGTGRCDFWCREQDDRQSWVELKVCATNYAQYYTSRSSPRPITQQIDEVVTDAKKLQTIPAAESNRHVFLLAYPMPSEHDKHADWSRHLDKLALSFREVARSFVIPLTFAGKSAALTGYKLAI